MAIRMTETGNHNKQSVAAAIVASWGSLEDNRRQNIWVEYIYSTATQLGQYGHLRDLDRSR